MGSNESTEDTSEAMTLRDSAAGAGKFRKDFTSRHQGHQLPNFAQSSLHDVKNQALMTDPGERRNLCLFLDNTESPNQQLSNFLCDPAVISTLNADYLLWGWDLTQAQNSATLQLSLLEEFGMSLVRDVAALRSVHLPAVVVVSRARGVTSHVILDSGIIADAAELVADLNNITLGNNQQKMREQMEGREREAERQLLQDQIDAHEKSLREDREKVERAEQEKKMKEAEVKRLEDLQKEREETRIKIKLPKQPTAASKNHITVRYRLEDGRQMERKFRRTYKVSDIINFAVKELGCFAEDFIFTTDFPRVLLNDVQNLNIEEAQLSAQEIVRVVCRDKM